MHYEVWTPLDAAARASRDADDVEHLEALPDKPYTVIGIITPLANAYGSDAKAVKAMRTEAARHGADAIFIETHPEAGGWHFSAQSFEGSDDCSGYVIFHAKAIAWQQPPASR
jgi:hypothetical protein